MANHVDESKNVESYFIQDERYDIEGDHRFFYKYGNEVKHPKYAIPTMDAMNCYSKYIRNYIDIQDNNLANSITNINTNITDIQKKINDYLASLTNILGNKNIKIYILTDKFYQDYGIDLLNSETKTLDIPIIPEYFADISNNNCFYRKNFVEDHITDTIVNINRNNSDSIINQDAEENYNEMKKRFIAYLQHCDIDDNTDLDNLNTNFYSKICESIGSDQVQIPSLSNFFSFFPTNFKYYLPKDFQELNNNVSDEDINFIIYDPYSGNIFQPIHGSKIDKTYYSIGGKISTENDSEISILQSFIGQQSSTINKYSYLNKVYNKLADWLSENDDEDRVKNQIKNQSLGLIQRKGGTINPNNEPNFNGYYFIDYEATVPQQYAPNFQITIDETTYIIKENESNRNNRVLTIIEKDELKSTVQNNYPFGAITVYCKFLTQVPRFNLWYSTDENIYNKGNSYRYKDSYDNVFIHNFLNKTTDNIALQMFTKYPVAGDYMYNIYTQEIVQVTSFLPNVGGVGQIDTVPVYTYVQTDNNFTKLYEKGTYLRGNSILSVSSLENTIISNNDQKIVFNTANLLSSNKQQEINTNRKYLWQAHSCIPGDLIIFNNDIYEVISKPYILVNSESVSRFNITAESGIWYDNSSISDTVYIVVDTVFRNKINQSLTYLTNPDLNDIISSGIYYFNASLTCNNIPNDLTGTVLLNILATQGGPITQIIYTGTNNYIRYYNSDTSAWTSWDELGIGGESSSSIDIITTTSSIVPTDSNVYSAAKADSLFQTKDNMLTSLTITPSSTNTYYSAEAINTLKNTIDNTKSSIDYINNSEPVYTPNITLCTTTATISSENWQVYSVAKMKEEFQTKNNMITTTNTTPTNDNYYSASITNDIFQSKNNMITTTNATPTNNNYYSASITNDIFQTKNNHIVESIDIQNFDGTVIVGPENNQNVEIPILNAAPESPTVQTTYYMTDYNNNDTYYFTQPIKNFDIISIGSSFSGVVSFIFDTSNEENNYLVLNNNLNSIYSFNISPPLVENSDLSGKAKQYILKPNQRYILKYTRFSGYDENIILNELNSIINIPPSNEGGEEHV